MHQGQVENATGPNVALGEGSIGTRKKKHGGEKHKGKRWAVS